MSKLQEFGRVQSLRTERMSKRAHKLLEGIAERAGRIVRNNPACW